MNKIVIFAKIRGEIKHINKITFKMIVDNLIRNKIPFAVLQYRKSLLIDRSICNTCYSIAIWSGDAEEAKDVRFAKGREEDNETDRVALLELSGPEQEQLLQSGILRKCRMVRDNKSGKVYEFMKLREYIKEQEKTEN